MISEFSFVLFKFVSTLLHYWFFRQVFPHLHVLGNFSLVYFEANKSFCVCGRSQIIRLRRHSYTQLSDDEKSLFDVFSYFLRSTFNISLLIIINNCFMFMILLSPTVSSFNHLSDCLSSSRLENEKASIFVLSKNLDCKYFMIFKIT